MSLVVTLAVPQLSLIGRAHQISISATDYPLDLQMRTKLYDFTLQSSSKIYNYLSKSTSWCYLFIYLLFLFFFFTGFPFLSPGESRRITLLQISHTLSHFSVLPSVREIQFVALCWLVSSVHFGLLEVKQLEATHPCKESNRSKVKYRLLLH